MIGSWELGGKWGQVATSQWFSLSLSSSGSDDAVPLPAVDPIEEVLLTVGSLRLPQRLSVRGVRDHLVELLRREGVRPDTSDDLEQDLDREVLERGSLHRKSGEAVDDVSKGSGVGLGDGIGRRSMEDGSKRQKKSDGCRMRFGSSSSVPLERLAQSSIRVRIDSSGVCGKFDPEDGPVALLDSVSESREDGRRSEDEDAVEVETLESSCSSGFKETHDVVGDILDRAEVGPGERKVPELRDGKVALDVGEEGLKGVSIEAVTGDGERLHLWMLEKSFEVRVGLQADVEGQLRLHEVGAVKEKIDEKGNGVDWAQDETK